MAEVGNSKRKGEEAGLLWPLALFCASFGLYAVSSSPAMGWLDSPEFVAQALALGVAHSPGHPLPALLGHLAGLIPIGDLVWRVNLMSALCAAASVSVLFVCAHWCLGLAAPRLSPRSSRILAAVFSGLVGLSWALWSSANRAEVYALQALLGTLLMLALVRYEIDGRLRSLLVAGLVGGLSLANHHLIALTLLLPGAAFVLLRQARPGLRAAMTTATMGLIGLLALLYLPVRASTHPEVNFGAPSTLGRFLWTLSGAAFSKSAGAEHVSTPVVDAMQSLSALASDLSVPILLLAFVGVALGLRHRPTRRLSLLLTAITILTIGVRVLLGFDPETPDHHAYLEPAVMALALLALLAVARLTHLASHARRPVKAAGTMAAILLPLLLPLRLASAWTRADLHAAWASDDIAHFEFAQLPPRSLILVAHFETSFRLWALHAVEGTRPDESILDRSFLSYPGMDAEARRRYPELSALIDAPLSPGHPSPIAALDEEARRRPVFAQLHPNVDGPLAARLVPAGPFAVFVSEQSTPARKAFSRADRFGQDLLTNLLDHSTAGDREALRSALLWRAANRMNQYCFLGWRDEAARSYRDAWTMAPTDTMLAELAQQCGLAPIETPPLPGSSEK